MSKAEHPKSLIVVGIYILVLVVSFVLIRPEYARSLRVTEAKGAVSLLGADRVVASVKTGNAIFDTMFRESGMVDWSYRTANDSRNGSAPLYNREKVADSMLAKTNAFWEMCRVAVQRVVFLFFWVPVLIPFIVAALIDGAMAREIRKWRFQFTSTTIYNHARRLAGLGVFVILLLPVLPVPMPILIYPAVGMLVAALAWASIANMQKRI